VTISAAEKEFLVKSLSTELQQHLINIRFMIGGTVTVENLTYTQIKEWWFRDGNPWKLWDWMRKIIKIREEKEESGMKTALNAFERGGRGRGSRDRDGRGGRERDERGGRGRGAGADSTQTPNTT
jgi:hypothetical protein